MSVRTVLKRRTESCNQPRASFIGRKAFHPRLEPLETRLAPACSVAISGGNLRVLCDGANDVVAVDTPTPTTTRVYDNGRYTTWQNAQFNAVLIEPQAGNDEAYVHQTAKLVSIDMGADNDRVYIAQRDRNLDRIGGLGVIAVGGGGGDQITLHDENSGFSGTYTVRTQFAGRLYQAVERPGAFGDVWYDGFAWGARLNGSARSPTWFNVQSVRGQSLLLDTGDGTNFISVHATTQSLYVLAGGGNDMVAISPEAQNLDNIQGYVQVNGGLGQEALAVYDSLNAAAHTWTLAQADGLSSVRRTGSAAIEWNDATGFERGAFINAGTGASTFNVTGTQSLGLTSVSTGAGDDTVNVRATVGALTIDLREGDDTAVIGHSDQNLDRLRGTVSVDGGPGLDALVIDDRANGRGDTWTLNSDGGAAGGVNRFGWPGVNYSGGFDRDFRVFAGAGSSTINVLNTPGWLTTLDAGPGVDTANVLRTTGGLNVTATGPQSDDIVNVGNAGRVQNILGAVSIANQSGGRTAVNVNDQNETAHGTPALDTIMPGVEVIRLLNLSAPIFSVSAQTSSFVVNLGRGNDAVLIGSTAAGVTTTVNSGEGSDGFAVGAYALSRLAGRLRLDGQADSAWLRVNDSAGTVGRNYVWSGAGLSWDGGGLEVLETANLTSVSLVAGQGDDVVAVRPGGPVPFTLDGGGGANALDYSAHPADVYVNLRTGTATGADGGIANIQQALGGSGNDILVGNGGNVLAGGPGRDVLIGGASPSVLFGDFFEDLGEDILIAGSTIHDTNQAALLAIRAYWAGGDTYETRVANLTAGNGVPRLDASTVTSNGGPNLILGGGGRDFVFCRPDVDVFIDPEDGETVVPI